MPKRNDVHTISVSRRPNLVTNDEPWFSDQAPDLGPGFSAVDAEQRRTTVIGILLRAAKRAEKVNSDKAKALSRLVNKLQACRLGLSCARAWQKAKTAAHEAIISATKRGRHPDREKQLYQPGQFSKIDVKKANCWLKDVLRSIGSRTIVGSAERYIQVHWHSLICEQLKTKLAFLLRGKQPRNFAPIESLSL
jgi:hypothetical protein